MIKKELLYLYRLSYSYADKEKGCVSFQVKDALQTGIKALIYQEDRQPLFNTYDITYIDKESLIEIDFLFKTLSDYQTHKNTIDKLIEYFLSPSGNNLLGQEITLDNYKEMLNQVFLAYQLEKDLENKEEIKKTKL